MDYRHELLINVLDRLRSEAPSSYSSYHSEKPDEIQRARSKSLIHLFLLVKFGLADFEQRHSHITDGSDDGGVDAYYFDEPRKMLYLFQSKFRSDGASRSDIIAEDLVKMEIRRILSGEQVYLDRVGNGKEFNGKIKQLQEKWRKLPDPARWTYKVVFIGGSPKYNDDQIRRILDLNPSELFEFYDLPKIYESLLFPFCSSSYYDPDEITIELNLLNKDQSVLKQAVNTQQGEFQVRVVFVPVEEIGRVLLKYKNAILKYNPRNYLSLSRNKVNKAIMSGIINSNANDFAIYNNGITMLCKEFKISETTGRENRGQVILERPQIINGGQTAYVLSAIYDDTTKRKLMKGKEVLLRAIVIPPDINDAEIREFISGISNATNQQTKVTEADRRSNDEVMISIQNNIFKEYGFLVERKKGEYYVAIKQGYVDNDRVIDRVTLLQAYWAFQGHPSEARSGRSRLFHDKQFKKIVGTGSDYKNMLLAAIVFSRLQSESNSDREWSNGLRYGKLAIVAAFKHYINTEIHGQVNEMQDEIDKILSRIKQEWVRYEKWVQKQSHNSSYSRLDGFDYDNYYKGKTLNNDIKEYYKNISK